MTDDAETIRAMLAARARAIGAGDADAAVAVAATADGAVTYDLQPPLAHAHDRAAAIAGLKEWFATWAGSISMEMREPAITVSGDLAVAYGLTRLSGLSKTAGPHESWFRDTVVFARQAPGWRIVHEHASYPTRMDGTGLSAIDLQPD